MLVELSCLSLGSCCGFQFRDDALGQHFAQLDAPLVERVDVPDRALGEDAVLVERDQLAERFRRQPVGQDRVRRTVALEDAVRHEPVGVPSALTCSGVLPKASASAWAKTLASSMS